MPERRRIVLVGLLALAAVATALLLSRVLATVFFAATVAIVLVPVYQWLRRRGLPRWWASTASTLVAFAAALVLTLPLVAVLYFRRAQLLDLLASLPDSVTVELVEFVYVVDIPELRSQAATYLAGLAIGVAQSTPELAAHATVFAFVVFGLLYGRTQLRRALLLPVPDAYHGVLHSLHERTRETLFALYVIQAATSVGTFVIALAVFWGLGYDAPITLAVIAGILQFLPVVGPSVLVVAVAGYEVSVGAYPRAALVLALGLLLIGFAPDAVIRPRLARTTAGLPSSLYFVGFTGGILSLGPVGIIAGPLVLALLVESLSLLADEERVDPEGPGATDSPSAAAAEPGPDPPPDPPPE